jgi:hypothetical protein
MYRMERGQQLHARHISRQPVLISPAHSRLLPSMCATLWFFSFVEQTTEILLQGSLRP